MSFAAWATNQDRRHVLYDLTFLEKKRYWPVPEESGRMKRYASNELLYKARHDAVFGNWWKLLRDDNIAPPRLIMPPLTYYPSRYKVTLF